MRELNARLRVAGLSDDEERLLPTHVDGPVLKQMELSTWRTDAGDFDVLADLPDRTAATCATRRWRPERSPSTSAASPCGWWPSTT